MSWYNIRIFVIDDETTGQAKQFATGRWDFLPRIGEYLLFPATLSPTPDEHHLPFTGRVVDLEMPFLYNDTRPVNIYLQKGAPAYAQVFHSDLCGKCDLRDGCHCGAEDMDTAPVCTYSFFRIADETDSGAQFLGVAYSFSWQGVPHIGEYHTDLGTDGSRIVTTVYNLAPCSAGVFHMQIYVKEEKPEYLQGLIGRKDSRKGSKNRSRRKPK